MTATSIATTEAGQARSRAVANRRARARLWDRVATVSLWGVAVFITLVFAYIVIYSVGKGLPHISWQFLTSSDPAVGIAAQLFNTIYLLIISLLVMIPVGMGTAVYVVEYARNQRFLSILRFATETLTSAPTLIIGLFGFLFFVTDLPIVHLGPLTIHGFGWGFSREAAVFTLAILNVPWMLRTSEDALRAVPDSLREASLAMGATKWQTVFRVVLPAAIPGLITSVLITAGRITGETAALVYTAGAGGSANFLTPALDHTGETLAYHAYELYSEPSTNSDGLRLGTALVLIVLVLILNITARALGGAINRRVSGRKA